MLNPHLWEQQVCGQSAKAYSLAQSLPYIFFLLLLTELTCESYLNDIFPTSSFSDLLVIITESQSYNLLSPFLLDTSWEENP